MKNERLLLSLSAVILAILLTVAAVFWYALRSVPSRAALGEVSGRTGRTLIIDPGHGGADGGAVSLTGTPESSINLAIAERVRLIAALFGVKTVMTRESEEIVYPEDAVTIHAKKVADTKARVQLANSIEDGVFLSIHQNKFTSPGPSGPQVFYAGTEGSEALAERLQELLLKELETGKERPAKKIGETIYIMNTVKCPAVLVECGFVSNPKDSEMLEEPGYQTKLAVVIAGGYLGYEFT